MEVGGGNAANGSDSFGGYRRNFPHSKSPDIGIALPPPQMPAKIIDNNNGSSSSPVDVSTAAAAAPPDPECTVREQDRFMPIANVIRIMRKILPSHAKISDDAKETIQECVSEFISFITGEANDRCQREQRKTITAEDVLWAMSKLGFDEYIEPLTLFLHRYREFDCGERGGSLRGEPLGKRAADHHSTGGMVATYGPPASSPHFHLGKHQVGFYGPTVVPVNGFLRNNHSSSSNANGGGPCPSSHEQVGQVNNGEQLFGGCKE